MIGKATIGVLNRCESDLGVSLLRTLCNCTQLMMPDIEAIEEHTVVESLVTCKRILVALAAGMVE